MNLNLSFAEFAKALDAQFAGGTGQVRAISTDTRTLQPGDIFFALRGEHFDAETIIDKAIERGAAAVVSQQYQGNAIPAFIVPDTRIALGHLARAHRARFNIPVIAITGSCGKTSTRVILSTLLSQHAETHYSRASFNNDIGLPLTICDLDSTHHYSVLEVGTNHFGELAYLSEIAKPTVALITMIAPVHVEFLQDEAGVARAKSELFQGLAADGTAILPADSPFLDYFQGILTTQKIVTFGLSEHATVRVKNIQVKPNGTCEFNLQSPWGECHIDLPLLGQHNVLNAAAAATAALVVGVPISKLPKYFAATVPEEKRLNVHLLKNGVTLIDDSYNANPVAVKAAIDVLLQQPARAEKILVLGDMGELGPQKEAYHADVGAYAKTKGVDYLLATGVLSMHAVTAFGEHGHFFATQVELISALREMLTTGQCVLVKGSKSSKMGNVVSALLTEE